ncbi:hypothetical protein HN832_03625 [archaeon]|jgi:hypothetical protein|nr:hypothetical protein [archaeon]MBT4373514.1 hypothetical protein [archaeon]MBT4531962.1 hypothetical protein [archaeon]MBT7001629.1 hypothetical protein [archaeon]MBT7282479.1 hypothetical protein [archaeon]
MDLNTLRTETLKLIEEYNQDTTHRKVEPINGYGQEDPQMMMYWAFWSDDIRSARGVGFTYINKELKVFCGKKEVIALEDTIDNFREQLRAIPAKAH